MIPDRFFFPLAMLIGAGLIALGLVYPQGQGARSPGRFGRQPVLQSPAVQAAMQHDAKIAAETKQALKEAAASDAPAADPGLRTTPAR